MRPTIVLLLMLGAPSMPAAAQSDLPLRDYVHTVWTQHDGAPLGEIFEILQSTDGYLWVNTGGVLRRFDGMRFVSESTPCTVAITSTVATPDGGFWATCGARLVRRTSRGQSLEVPQTVFSDSRTFRMLVDRQGRPWLFGASIRYLEKDGTGGGEVSRPTKSAIKDAVYDSDDVLWVSDGNQVVRMGAGHNEGMAVEGVRCLAPAREGGVYAATDDRLWRLRAGARPSSTTAPRGVAFTNYPDCMKDTGSGLWIGTRQQGTALVRDGQIETLSASGRSDRFINELFVDREGTIWAGATAGLHRFRKPMVEVVDSTSSLVGAPLFVFVDSGNVVWTSATEGDSTSRIPPTGPRRLVASPRARFVAIGEDRAGRVWLSNNYDIGYVSNGQFVRVPDSANRSVAGVWSFTQDGGGQLWALAKDIGLYRVSAGPPRLVLKSQHAAIRFLVSERFGTWISLRGGGVERHFDGRIDTFRYHSPNKRRRENSAPIGLVLTIIEDGDSIWVGTLSGLRRWRGGQWTDWTSEHGLPGQAVVNEIATDRFGRFWMMTRGGILVVSRAELDATPDGMPRPLSFARIGVLDGVVPHPGSMQPSPRMSRDRLGRLFFATYDSVVRVDPSEVSESSLAPPIVLESVTIDNRAIDPAMSQTFVEPSRLQFDYTSLSLRSPENARFRYQLEGYDADWIDAGGQRHVTYGSLPPGSYRFRVTGAGSEGVWNEKEASFTFQITPVFWRTWWFGMTLVAFGSLVIAGLHRLRVRQLTRQFNIGLEARVDERTRVARELHDTLLQTVQGSKMVADHALKDSADHSSMVGAMEQLSMWLAQAAEEGRAALNSLRASSTETDDLAQALRRAIDECRASGGTEMSMSVIGEAEEIHPVVRDEVYRIAFEAIRNACAHSEGDRIDVSLVYGDDLTVRISDNGAGIEPLMIDTGRDGHFGLRGMRERAERIGGTVTMVGSSGSGTVVTLVVPGPGAFLTGRRSRT